MKNAYETQLRRLASVKILSQVGLSEKETWATTISMVMILPAAIYDPSAAKEILEVTVGLLGTMEKEQINYSAGRSAREQSSSEADRSIFGVAIQRYSPASRAKTSGKRFGGGEIKRAITQSLSVPESWLPFENCNSLMLYPTN